MLLLANITGWVIAHYREVIISSAIFLCIVSVALWAYCGKSRIEKRIEDRQPVIVEQQQGANQAINAAINANVEANKALANAREIRANKARNVSIEEAERNKCLAYPELCR